VDRWKCFGIRKEIREAMLKNIVEELLLQGYLTETNDIYRIIKLTPECEEILTGDVTITCKWSERKEEAKSTKIRKKKNGKAEILNAKGLALFDKLRARRMELAREENLPPYIIFSDKTLVDMCVKLPFTKDEMLEVTGVGENKYNRYGEQFIQEIVDFTDAVKDIYYYKDLDE